MKSLVRLYLVTELDNGRTANEDSGIVVSWNAKVIKGETGINATKDGVSRNALNDLPRIIENAILLDTVVSDSSSKSKHPNTAFMHSFYAVYDTKNERYILKLYVEQALSSKSDEMFSRAYLLKDIKKIAELPNGVSEVESSLSDDSSATSVISISKLHKIVNTYDKQFNPKPVSKEPLNAVAIRTLCFRPSTSAPIQSFYVDGSDPFKSPEILCKLIKPSGLLGLYKFVFLVRNGCTPTEQNGCRFCAFKCACDGSVHRRT